MASQIALVADLLAEWEARGNAYLAGLAEPALLTLKSQVQVEIECSDAPDPRMRRFRHALQADFERRCRGDQGEA